MTAEVRAAAKLNLYLDIVGIRHDGYHLLETVMQSISLYDNVTVDMSDGTDIDVACDNPDIPCGKDNIAYKAASCFLDAAGIAKSVKIHIEKHIPSGAGMGGGSADAAAVLRALYDMTGKPIPERKLYDIALGIGADVPFCLAGGTRLCKGIGEEISYCGEISDCFFVVVMPNFTCPTGTAYKRYDCSPVLPKNGLEDFLSSINGVFADKMYNVFEVLYDDPRIYEITARLKKLGAEAAMLTGSGAAVFGVFTDESEAKAAAAAFTDNFTSICRPIKQATYFTIN